MGFSGNGNGDGAIIGSLGRRRVYKGYRVFQMKAGLAPLRPAIYESAQDRYIARRLAGRGATSVS